MEEKSFFKIYIPIILILVVVLCFFALKLNEKNDKLNETVADNIKFMEEYTSLNGKDNGNGKNYPNVTLDENNIYYYASENEIIELLKSGTGVIFFGYPTCPWCRNVVSILNEVVKNNGYDKIYYYNIKPIRSTISLDENDKLVIEKGNDFYYELLSILDDFLTEYNLTNSKGKSVDTGEKRLYAPTVVFVKDGKIIGLTEGTIDEQTDPYILLTDEQKEELGKIYQENLLKLADICDEKC